MTNIKQGICIFVNWFYPYPKVGGIEIYSYRLAKGLAEAGMNVFILTRKFKGAKSKEIVGGVPVNRISIFGKGILASFILMVLSSWFLIRHRKIFSSILKKNQLTTYRDFLPQLSEKKISESLLAFPISVLENRKMHSNMWRILIRLPRKT